jgi:multisubunit Na+/H+ antiporter MnhC subunit
MADHESLSGHRVEETGRLASYQDAAGLQVTSARLTGRPFGIYIPNGPGACAPAAGIVEADATMITRLPLAALIIASLFWGTAVSVSKYALRGFGPVTLLAAVFLCERITGRIAAALALALAGAATLEGTGSFTGAGLGDSLTVARVLGAILIGLSVTIFTATELAEARNAAKAGERDTAVVSRPALSGRNRQNLASPEIWGDGPYGVRGGAGHSVGNICD